ncbi:MAG: hypothetical protein E7503_02015 [Ruminococcus sp.]|nr:hypothetical protein [Ruminococcus sp.]
MKDNEKLLQIIGEVDEQYVPDPVEQPNTKPVRTFSGRKKIAIASGACAAVLIGAFALKGAMNPPKLPPQSPTESSAAEQSSMEDSRPDETSKPENSHTEPITTDVPPIPPISDEAFAQLLAEHRIYPPISDIQAKNTELAPIASDIIFGDMGFEGYLAYDIAELDTINPWSPDVPLATLPVYKNLSLRDDCTLSVYLTQQQMEQMAADAAYAMDLAIQSTTVERIGDLSPHLPAELADLPYCVETICDGSKYNTGTISIRVFGDGQMAVKFVTRNMALPKAYSFTGSKTTGEQAATALDYLAGVFRGLLQFESPAPYSYADRNIYGSRNRSYYIYNKCEDYKQDILSYNFTKVEFCPGGRNALMIIRLDNPLAAAENVGEYPIIDAQEATQLLLKGSYISSVPADYLVNGEITPEAIGKTELIYRLGTRDAYYQPYYRFYVELSDAYYAEGSRLEGLKEYGAFYVPAVESRYLADLPVWDGSFN